MSVPTVDYDVTDQAYRAIRGKKNFMMLLTGMPGSGKSYAGMSFCKRLSDRLGTRFDGWNICFSVESLINRLEEIKPGTPILFDEAGASFSSRRSMSQQNIAFSTIIQTFRFLHIPLVWTFPNWNQIDINARRLAHCHMVATGWNEATQLTRVKYLNIVHPPVVGNEAPDVIRKYPRVKVGGRVVKIKNIYVPKPEDLLVEEYEVMAAIQKRTLIKTNKTAPDPYMESLHRVKPVMDVGKPKVSGYLKYDLLHNKDVLIMHLKPEFAGGRGFTVAQLADTLKCDKSTIYKAIHKHGIDLMALQSIDPHLL